MEAAIAILITPTILQFVGVVANPHNAGKVVLRQGAPLANLI
jgi:hypothetical protein